MTAPSTATMGDAGHWFPQPQAVKSLEISEGLTNGETI